MTLIIIIITCIFSLMAFNKPELMYKYQFNPYQVYHRKQWYRLFSYAFLHANWMHLFVNMFVLYSFGSFIENRFRYYFDSGWGIYFIILYLSSIIVSTLFTLIKQRDNYYYNAVGASGAVSAIVFSSILFEPMSKLLIFGIVPVSAIIFGVLYLIYSYYMSKKNIDNIGHDEHFLGAIYGFIFPILIKPELFNIFLYKIFG
jgi:membrane associated rhomboid family serine protease